MSATICDVMETVNEFTTVELGEITRLRRESLVRVPIWKIIGLMLDYQAENDMLRRQVAQMTADIGKLHTTLDAVEGALKELQRERFLSPLENED